MYEIKTKDIYEDFSNNKELFEFSNYLTKSKYYNDSRKLLIDKMKDKILVLQLKNLLDWSQDLFVFARRIAKSVNKNVVEQINHNEYEDVLMNNKCLRHSVNRIQIKDQRIRNYEINKISLSCFDDKIYTQNIGYDGLVLGYQR